MATLCFTIVSRQKTAARKQVMKLYSQQFLPLIFGSIGPNIRNKLTQTVIFAIQISLKTCFLGQVSYTFNLNTLHDYLV